MKKKDYVGTNNEMKDDVAVNSLKKDGDESVQRVLQIKLYERLQEKTILCIHSYENPSSMYARNCTTVQT